MTKEITTTLPECEKLSQEGRNYFNYVNYHFTNSALMYKGFANIMNNFDAVKLDVNNGV
jgi:hypothetical protein